MTSKQAQKLPRILRDYVNDTGIAGCLKTEANVLEEAEYQLQVYHYMDLEDGGYTRRNYNDLERFANRLRNRGVSPIHWENS